MVEIETASENDFLKKHLQSIGATSKQSFALSARTRTLWKKTTPLKPLPEGRTNFANVCVISNYRGYYIHVHCYVRLVLFSPFTSSNNFALLNSFGSVHIFAQEYIYTKFRHPLLVGAKMSLSTVVIVNRIPPPISANYCIGLSDSIHSYIQQSPSSLSS